MVGLDGLEGLLQPKGFYDSIIILHLRQGSGFAGQCGWDTAGLAGRRDTSPTPVGCEEHWDGLSLWSLELYLQCVI